MSEPREFWIDDFLSDKADFVTCVSRAPKTHFIHVIEKSAYDALEARCKKLEEEKAFIIAYTKPADTSFRDMMDTFSKLPEDKRNKLIDLTRSLAALAQDEVKDE